VHIRSVSQHGICFLLSLSVLYFMYGKWLAIIVFICEWQTGQFIRSLYLFVEVYFISLSFLRVVQVVESELLFKVQDTFWSDADN
jgi:uncharacterized membrane protein (Fun14 family)